jgi:hypothetical protein
MAIVFHCEHCAKKIEAPDVAGGKRGKCPACHNRVYVPAPKTNDDNLHLAPIDSEEEDRRKKMMAETYNVTQQLLEEKNVPEVPPEELPAPPGGLGVIRLPTVDQDTLEKTIVRYLQLMAAGELDQAAKLEETITRAGSRANQILEQIALNQIPDEKLAALPPQVLSALIRTLRSQIR